MINNKLGRLIKAETFVFACMLLFLIVNAIIKHDSIQAFISAFCGITYTALAGKGLPVCYLFGVCGSGFYGFISFQNALWGNLILYVCYYIPMQILGFFKWNKNLKQDRSSIIKASITKRDMIILIILSLIGISVLSGVLYHYNDTHPILDSATTIMSVIGMYLTVRRSVQQWICWIIVNALSLYMWLSVALTGAKVWSTVIMWACYLVLGIYFYIQWKKELKLQADEIGS